MDQLSSSSFTGGSYSYSCGVAMKVYIAGRWSQRSALHEIRKQLSALQYEVVSSWIDEGDANDFDQAASLQPRLAMRDLVQIAMADILILDETAPLSEGSGGGREVEFGFAIGQFQHKRCWIVGEPRNPFHHLAEHVYPTWEELLLALDTQKPPEYTAE